MTLELLSVADVAAFTGLSEYTIRAAVADGELPACKLRGRIKISRDDFVAWVDENRVRPGIGDLLLGTFNQPKPRPTVPASGARAAVRAAKRAA